MTPATTEAPGESVGICDLCGAEQTREDPVLPEPEPEPEPETQPETEPATEPETEAATEPSTEPETVPETIPETEPEPDTGLHATPRTEPQQVRTAPIDRQKARP